VVQVPKAALVQATSTKPSSSAPQAVTPSPAPAGAGESGAAEGGESDKVRITAQEAYDLTKSAQTGTCPAAQTGSSSETHDWVLILVGFACSDPGQAGRGGGRDRAGVADGPGGNDRAGGVG
jgi:hypothetical protein